MNIHVVDLCVLVIFLVGLVYIGKMASKKVNNDEDFYLAGRSLSKFSAGISTAASDFGGSGLVGAAGLAYGVGIAGGWWDLCAAPAFIILGILVASDMRKINLTTVPEYLEKRYNLSARIIAAVLHILSTAVKLTAQMLVASYALTTLTGIPEEYSLIIATAVFVIYTAAGGLRAVVNTDILQYFILMVAILIVIPLGLYKVGGIASLKATLPESYFSLSSLGYMTPLAWIAMCFYMYGTQQYFLQRLFASKDPQTARFAYLFTGVNYIIYGFLVALIGMIAAVLFPGLENHELAITMIIQNVLPIGISGLAIAALFAATMSTADSMLASCSTMFTVDIYQRLIKKDASEVHYLKVARISTILLALIALVLSYVLKSVVSIIVLGSLMYCASVFFPLILGFYWKRGNAYGAVAAIVIGSIMSLISKFFLYKQVGGLLGWLDPMYTGSLIALAVYIIVSLLTPKPAEENLKYVAESKNDPSITANLTSIF